uniref:Uncharacterized protein n=1 Tax=Anguilla anguilla TaxID=7936 RepID=A0A0E9V3F3_ANGAN
MISVNFDIAFTFDFTAVNHPFSSGDRDASHNCRESDCSSSFHNNTFN